MVSTPTVGFNHHFFLCSDHKLEGLKHISTFFWRGGRGGVSHLSLLNYSVVNFLEIKM